MTTPDISNTTNPVPKQRRSAIRWMLVGAPVALILIGVVALKLMFPPDALRALVEPMVERRVGRPVAIGAVSLKVFPRIVIRLERVSLPNPSGFGPEPAARLEALDLELKFWPLLRKEFVLNRVTLREPSVHYLVSRDGTNNFAGLRTADSAGLPAQAPVPGTRRAASLLVSDLRILDGTLLYRDDGTGRSAAMRLGASASLRRSKETGGGGIVGAGDIELADIRVLAVAGIDTLAIPDSRIGFTVTTYPAGDSLGVGELSIAIGAVTLDGSGTVRNFADRKVVDFSLASGVIDLAEFLAALPDRMIPDSLILSGRATLNLRAAGAMAEGLLAVAGSARLEDMAVSHAGRDIALTGVAGDVTFDRDSLRTAGLQGMLWNRPITVDLALVDFADPTVAGRARGSVSLARLPSPENAPSPEGTAEFDITFRGPAKNPEALLFNGPVDLTGVVYHHRSLAVPARIERARVQLAGADVTANAVTIAMGRSDVTVSFRAPGVIGFLLAGDSTTAPPPITFTLTSTVLDLSELLPDTLGYGTLVAARLAGKRLQGLEPGDIARQRYKITSRPRARVSGQVRLDDVVNPPTRGRNIVFDVDLANGVLEVKNLTGQLYDGAVTGGLTLDLRPAAPPYPVRYGFQFRGAQSSYLLRRWTRLGSAVTGKVDFDIDGVAALDDGLLPQLDAVQASGSATIKDGRFQEFAPAQALVDRLQLQGPERSTFRQLGGVFKIERGALVVDDWSYEAAQVSGTVTGSAALSGGLDLTASLKVPPELLGRMGLLQGGGALTTLTQQLAGSDQSLDLSVGIGGTTASPTLRVDTEALRIELQRRLSGEGRGLLDRLLKPKSDQQPAPTPSPSP
jgi:hypothetical protein